MSTKTEPKTAERYVLTIGDGSGSGNPDDAGIKFVGMWNFESLDEAICWKEDLESEREKVTLQVVFTDGSTKKIR